MEAIRIRVTRVEFDPLADGWLAEGLGELPGSAHLAWQAVRPRRDSRWRVRIPSGQEIAPSPELLVQATDLVCRALEP